MSEAVLTTMANSEHGEGSFLFPLALIIPAHLCSLLCHREIKSGRKNFIGK
jgi:hypothetical protein